MGTIHDNLATNFGDNILNRLRTGNSDIQQIFSTKIIKSADWDWPRPDYVCIDEELKCSYALEFKPPHQSKREYMTGLGQAISYLQKHLYSGLIIPMIADDGFKIADFIAASLKADEFKKIALSLYCYNPSNIDSGVSLLRGIEEKRDSSKVKAIDINKIETFWCWWRDCSQYELFNLLELGFLYNDYDGDIYTDKIYPKFYERLVTKSTKQWNGVPREKKDSEKSRKSEKQNYKIPLTQLELWNEGHLTDLGFKMLEIGKKYGPNSEAFINALGYLILVNGKHLELIKDFELFQKEQETKIPTKSKDFLLRVEKYLTDKGRIGSRKPTAITTNAKTTYIRDEPKLWNKLDILQMSRKNNYFFEKEGYKFNWHKISDILISGSQLLNKERIII
jgi:hypothetical protein